MNHKQQSSNKRLNWDRIIQSDGDTTNRGIKFENLIEQLLIAMYGEKKWRRTQSSHDGKKDFAAPYEDFGRDTHWAESFPYIGHECNRRSAQYYIFFFQPAK